MATQMIFRYKDGKEKNPFSVPDVIATKYFEFEGKRFERKEENGSVYYTEIGKAKGVKDPINPFAEVD